MTEETPRWWWSRARKDAYYEAKEKREREELEKVRAVWIERDRREKEARVRMRQAAEERERIRLARDDEEQARRRTDDSNFAANAALGAVLFSTISPPTRNEELYQVPQEQVTYDRSPAPSSSYSSGSSSSYSSSSDSSSSSSSGGSFD